MEGMGIMTISLIQKIKNFFKSFYPIPTKSFMREINRSNGLIQSSYNGIKKIISAQATQMQKIESEIESQNKQIVELSDIFLSQAERINMLNTSLDVQDRMLRSLLEELNSLQEKAIDSISERVGQIFQFLSENQEWSQEEMATRIISATVHRINPTARKVFYTGELERRFYKNTFNVNIFESENFSDRVKKLFEGLDSESISTAARALTRLKKIVQYNEEKMNLDIYTAEEQEFLNTEFQRFNLSILPLSDSLFVWNGYYLPINHFEYCVFGDSHGIRNFKNLDAIRNKAIMDIGAFIGDSALVLSSYTDKNVYSFEASPSNFELMRKTIELNHKTNIIPENMVLGSEKNSTCVINLAKQISCNSINKNDGFNYVDTFEVKATTLDDFVEKNGLEVGLIKVDIEGAEQDFLKGAIKTIMEQKPALIISIYHNADDFFEIKPMLDELHLGYTFRIYHPIINTIFTETVLLAEIITQ